MHELLSCIYVAVLSFVISTKLTKLYSFKYDNQTVLTLSEIS